MFRLSQKILSSYYPTHLLGLKLEIDDKIFYEIKDAYIHELILFSNIFPYLDSDKELLYDQILTFSSLLSNDYLIDTISRDFALWTDDLFTTFNNFAGIIGLKLSRNIIDDLLKAQKIKAKLYFLIKTKEPTEVEPFTEGEELYIDFEVGHIELNTTKEQIKEPIICYLSLIEPSFNKILMQKKVKYDNLSTNDLKTVLERFGFKILKSKENFNLKDIIQDSNILYIHKFRKFLQVIELFYDIYKKYKKYPLLIKQPSLFYRNSENYILTSLQESMNNIDTDYQSAGWFGIIRNTYVGGDFLLKNENFNELKYLMEKQYGISPNASFHTIHDFKIINYLDNLYKIKTMDFIAFLTDDTSLNLMPASQGLILDMNMGYIYEIYNITTAFYRFTLTDGQIKHFTSYLSIIKNKEIVDIKEWKNIIYDKQ